VLIGIELEILAPQSTISRILKLEKEGIDQFLKGINAKIDQVGNTEHNLFILFPGGNRIEFIYPPPDQFVLQEIRE